MNYVNTLCKKNRHEQIVTTVYRNAQTKGMMYYATSHLSSEVFVLIWYSGEHIEQ